MSHDSISRYDASADRFSSFTANKLKDPEEVFRSMTVRSKDTLESSQEKIDAEIINRLQINAGGITQDKLPVVARAGKFVFMAVAVPTYLIAYSFPKWVATQLIPNSCQLLGNALKHCFRPMQEWAMLFFRQMQQLVKVLKREQSRIFKTLTNFKGLLVILKHPFKKMKALWNQLKEKAAEKKNSLQEWLSELNKGVRTKLKKVAETAKNKTTRLVYGRLTTDEPLAPWRQAIVNTALKIYRTYKFVTGLPRRITDAVKKTIYDLYKAYVFPHVDRATKFIQRIAKRIKVRQEAITNACKRFIHKQTERVKRFNNAVKESITQSAVKFSNFIGIPTFVNAITSKWQGVVQKFSNAKTGIQNLRQKVTNKFKALSKGLKFPSLKQFIPSFSLPSGFVSWVKAPIRIATRFTKRVQKLLKTLRSKIPSIPKLTDKKWKPFAFLANLKTKAGRKTRRAIYYTRLTGSWTRILTGFWMASVRNICQNCVEHLTWKDILYFVRKFMRSTGILLGFIVRKTRISRTKTA
ncbi:MAG: hypothetical protein WC222_12265 [Parachlamydiales bacterium]|jgi:phage-related protein